MTTIATDTQARAHTMLQGGLAALAIAQAEVEYTGTDNSPHPYEGAAVGFESGDGRARMVFVYQDEDGAWMVDAMDADIGIPAPGAYSLPRLIASLIWAQGQEDEAFADLAQASVPVAR